MLADSETDIPRSQYKALEILSSGDAQGLANEPATPARSSWKVEECTDELSM